MRSEMWYSYARFRIRFRQVSNQRQDYLHEIGLSFFIPGQRFCLQAQGITCYIEDSKDKQLRPENACLMKDIQRKIASQTSEHAPSSCLRDYGVSGHLKGLVGSNHW